MAPRSRATRSSANRGSSAKSSSRQSSLTFNNSRVTKPTGAISAKDKKAANEAEAKAAKLVQEVHNEPEVKDEIEEVTADAEEETEDKASANIPIRTQQPQPKAQPPATGPEANAKKISETQIRKYWKEKEAERKTPRVHQEGLSLHEKILREFDMSYQYGPCIGISRPKRWTRADNLGLKPPIEVLAVLLKEDAAAAAQKDRKFERAHMDVLANSRHGVVA